MNYVAKPFVWINYIKVINERAIEALVLKIAFFDVKSSNTFLKLNPLPQSFLHISFRSGVGKEK